jgi:hypothetical protein
MLVAVVGVFFLTESKELAVLVEVVMVGLGIIPLLLRFRVAAMVLLIQVAVAAAVMQAAPVSSS